MSDVTYTEPEPIRFVDPNNPNPESETDPDDLFTDWDESEAWTETESGIHTPPPKKLNRIKFIRKLYEEVGGPEAKAGSKPHLGQRLFHESTARFRTSVWGRRGGKSFAGGSEVSPRVFTKHTDGFPHKIWIVAPNYDLGEREYRVIWHQIVHVLGVPCNWKYFTKGPGGRMAFQTAWGTEVWVKSAENPDKGLLGEGLTFVIMAEAARLNRSIWEQYIEPALADRDGEAIFTSTPQGMNWLKLFADRGDNPDPEFDDWESFQFPSWVNEYRFPGGLHFQDLKTKQKVAWERVAAKPDMKVEPTEDSNPKLVASWKHLSRHYFWQEYGAQFRTQAGRVYPDFDPGYHVRPHVFIKGAQNYRTIDYGTTNPFVCLDIQVDEYGVVYVWREWRRTSHSTLDNVQWAQTPKNLGYHLTAVVGDPYEPDGRLTTENEWGIPCQFVTMGVKNGIELVERRLKLQKQNDGEYRPTLFFDPQCVGAINEFQSYRWKETLDEELYADNEFIIQDEKNPLDVPLKANDHAPDALRNFLAWYEGDTLVQHGEQTEAYNEGFEPKNHPERPRSYRERWDEALLK